MCLGVGGSLPQNALGETKTHEFLFLQDYPKKDTMLGSKNLELTKASDSMAALNTFASVWQCFFKFYI